MQGRSEDKPYMIVNNTILTVDWAREIYERSSEEVYGILKSNCQKK
jgi:hypothetical protein